MTDARWEEAAALAPLGLLDDPTELENVARRDPNVRAWQHAYAATAAALAYEAAQVEPPLRLRAEIMDRLSDIVPSMTIEPKRRPYLAYALVAVLLALVVTQAVMIGTLNRRLATTRNTLAGLQRSHSMLELQLADLKTTNADYVNARIMVAWDPHMHRGMVSVHDLPMPPAGHDYQLWVLDPSSSQPVSAGVLAMPAKSQDFAIRPMPMKHPGFAVSLEPAGGRATPTPGEILFAVAPGL